MIDIRNPENPGDGSKINDALTEIFEPPGDNKKKKLEAYANQGPALSASADFDSESKVELPQYSPFYQAMPVTPEE